MTNIEDGGLTAEVWAVKNKSVEKSEEIKFVNKYEKPEIPKQPQTGDETNLTLWMGLYVASLLVAAGLFFWKKIVK